jgi:hypothetical protein
MVEPSPPEDFQVVLSDPAMAATVPRLLLLRLTKV